MKVSFQRFHQYSKSHIWFYHWVNTETIAMGIGIYYCQSGKLQITVKNEFRIESKWFWIRAFRLRKDELAKLAF